MPRLLAPVMYQYSKVNLPPGGKGGSHSCHVDEPLKEGGGPRQNKGRRFKFVCWPMGVQVAGKNFSKGFLMFFIGFVFLFCVCPCPNIPGEKHFSLFNALGVSKIPPSLCPPHGSLANCTP